MPRSMLTATPESLTPHETARLIDFARACKAAARAVLLYPTGHPAIAATLGRIVQLTSSAALPAPMRIAVLGRDLRLHGKAPGRTDSAIGELAQLLHGHLIAELTVHSGGDHEAWRSFLLLLGRSPEDSRSEGGMARLWTTQGGRHVEIREIDYAEVLRERAGGAAAGWADIIDDCLRGGGTPLDEHTRRLLLEASADVDRLFALAAALDLEAVATGGGTRARAAALIQLFDRIVETVSDATPDAVPATLETLSAALAQRPPDVLAAMLTDTVVTTEKSGVVRSVSSRMSEATIAGFVARHALAPGTPVERLATAFQTLVPEDRRERVLSLAREDASHGPAAGADFDAMWERVAATLMTSYSDAAYVSEAYGRELSSAKTIALDVEHLSDDPPERIAAWLTSVSASELRRLDIALVRDLLRLEADPERWATLMRPVVGLVEDLLLVGDFGSADELVGVLVGERLRGRFHRQAGGALDALVDGPLLRYVASHLDTADEKMYAQAKSVCLSLGDGLIRPLAELIAADASPRVRERLSAMLIAFGPGGRGEVERLKTSSNAAVRRTAIYLLRAFGGLDALPDLTGLLHDGEVQVQREALRAILAMGTDEAYRVLVDALTEGARAQRKAIFASLLAVRDERVAPVLAYVVDHVNHRGPLGELHLRAIHALGSPRGADGVEALARALRRGEWWAPRRTRALRDAAAAALARIGTPGAIRALQEARASGSRGVRRAVAMHLKVNAPQREGV
ncbi:MAG: HEAT repeat domain-containing protein [Vicinamibacterales bacterium]